MRVLVVHRVALYELALFLQSLHDVFVGIFYEHARVVTHFFGKTALSVNRLDERNARSRKDFAVVLTESWRDMDDARTVLG